MKKIFLLIVMCVGVATANADNKAYFQKAVYEVVKGGSVKIPICYQTDVAGVTSIQGTWTLTAGSGASGVTVDTDNPEKVADRYSGTVTCAFAGNQLLYAWGVANPLIGNDGPLINVTFNAAATATGEYTFTWSGLQYAIYPTKYDCDPNSASVTIRVVDYVTIDENDDFTPFAISAKDVHVIRSFEANKYYTLCLPITANATKLKNTFGTTTAPDLYQFTGVTCELNGDGDKVAKVSLNFTKKTLISANTPYIMYSKVDITNPVFSSVTMSVKTEGAKTEVTEDTETGANVSFVGTYKNITLDAGALYLKSSEGKLYSSPGAVKMKGTRAYFDLSDFENQGFPMTEVKMCLDGVETGIEALDADLSAEGWFDLNGRKLAEKPATRGIYINNGKKVVVK